MLYELCVCSRSGIFAVPYRAGRRGRPVRLPDGAIVEEALPDERRHISSGPDEVLGIAAGGIPATIHHANLGLVLDYVRLSGVFFLSSGEVAAVYGAKAVRLGAGTASAHRS